MPSYDRLTLNHEFLWRYTASRDFVAGDYLWTGIDYLGETRWPAHGAGSGPIDTAGFPKDTFYYFRSIWNRDDTTLHICPHWNWTGHEGEFITVIGYTDCDEVSLYLNGCLIGTKGYDCPNVGHAGAWNILARNTRPTTHDLHLSWDVPFKAGELRAVGYKDGRAVIERVVKTTGIPGRIQVQADTEALPLYGIAHIEIGVLDNEGIPVPTADTLIKARVEGGDGSVVLLGLDNGNLVDNTLFGSGARVAERRLFAGRLLCVIRGIEKGAAKLVLSADAMEDEAITFTIG
jgi:beta-galactosidase